MKKEFEKGPKRDLQSNSIVRYIHCTAVHILNEHQEQ